ncbi:MAG: hypothetical protein KAR47_09565, partial [Planctomycetes bacterium]|nr:hypothetical protein [Planctomycetota bacterium]
DANHIAYFVGPDPGLDNVLASTPFNAEGIDKINKNGTTQLRFRFTNLYDVDRNHLGFYSGGYSDPNYHPRLIVDYVAPTDTKAPGPDPANWASRPEPTSSYSITMTSATATDLSGAEYYFENMTDPAHDSGWQNSRVYVDTLLTPNTVYTYRVKMRDKSENQNENTFSAPKPARTLTGLPLVETSLHSVGADDGRIWGNDAGYKGKNYLGSNNMALLLGGGWQSGGAAYSYGYAAVLSFDTADVPDDVTIMAARIEMTRGGISGATDPFTWGGTCYVDIIKPFFGTGRQLENVDWDADPNDSAVATFAGPDPGVDTPMLSSFFTAEALSHIDVTSTTQMRVRFTNLYNEP